MCTRTIIDASVFSLLDCEAMREWNRWIVNGHGVIVYTTHGQYGTELTKKVKDFLAQVRRSRETLLIREPQIRDADRRLRSTEIRSNDAHILQLALAGDVRVLCTNDGDLTDDFRDRTILPAVGRKQRSVYPHKAARRARQQFLYRRKCPNRNPR